MIDPWPTMIGRAELPPSLKLRQTGQLSLVRLLPPSSPCRGLPRGAREWLPLVSAAGACRRVQGSGCRWVSAAGPAAGVQGSGCRWVSAAGPAAGVQGSGCRWVSAAGPAALQERIHQACGVLHDSGD
jgi:hypothetical protein